MDSSTITLDLFNLVLGYYDYSNLDDSAEKEDDKMSSGGGLAAGITSASVSFNGATAEGFRNGSQETKQNSNSKLCLAKKFWTG